LSVGLARLGPWQRGLLAFVVPPLAPFWGYHGKLHRRSLIWIIAVTIHIACLTAAAIGGSTGWARAVFRADRARRERPVSNRCCFALHTEWYGVGNSDRRARARLEASVGCRERWARVARARAQKSFVSLSW